MMIEAFENHLRFHNLFAKVDRILVAVSGGRDSMVLAHLLHNGGYSIGVAHMNFNLRGEDSRADEKLVAAWCRQEEVPFFVKQVDTHVMAQEAGLSTQMAAREARYAWFDELMLSEGYDYVATAHHLQDALEGTLLNLSRGTGPLGIAGIRPKVNNRVRPLLFATREQITDYAKEHVVTWREDASNAETKYQRNFVRHEVLPKMKTLNPSLWQTYGSTHARLTAGVEQLTFFQDEWLAKHIQFSYGFPALSFSSLEKLPDPAGMFYQWLSPYGFTYTVLIDAISNYNGLSGRYWESGTHELYWDRGSFVLVPKQELSSPKVWPTTKDTLEVPIGRLTRAKELNAGNWPRDAAVGLLDAAKLSGDWVLRPWQEGDWFVPLGMKGRKKVSDFLVDAKVPRYAKSRIWVLEVGMDIVWLVGHRIDDRFKIDDETHMYYTITFEP